MNLAKKKKAFTLIELIIVIAILALLAAIAIPKYNASRETARKVAHNTNIQTLKSAAYTYLAEKSEPVTWKEDNTTAWEKYLDKWPKNPIKGGESYEVKIKEDGTVIVTPEPEDIEDKKTQN